MSVSVLKLANGNEIAFNLRYVASMMKVNNEYKFRMLDGAEVLTFQTYQEESDNIIYLELSRSKDTPYNRTIECMYHNFINDL